MKRGEKVFKELLKVQEDKSKLEEWLKNLSDSDFSALLSLRICSVAKIHYIQLRRKVKSDI